MDLRRFPRAIAPRLLIAAMALAILLLHVESARALTGRPRLVLPSVDTVQLGPITAADGFSLYLTVQDCGSSAPYVQLAYVKGGPADELSHTYTGASVSCSIQRAPAGADVSVSVPGFIDVDVHITNSQAALAHPGLPVGCSAPYGPELPATATGQIDVAIHPGVFGRISLANASAQIFSGAPQDCPGLAPTSGRELTADVGPFVLNADQPSHGQAELEILDASRDSPTPDLQGVLELQMTGHGALGVNLSNGSTRIGASTDLTAGALNLALLPVCPGYQAQNGALTGTLTLEDPLFGPLRIDGTEASVAFSGEGSAQPGNCDGPGSEPVSPDLISTCNQDDSDCSVSSDASVATFFDETSAGTQTITSELVNFGDGSTPVAITNYGAVEHVYASEGIYIATLAVTDAFGATTSTTIPVVIDP